MNTHADKTQENKSQSVSAVNSQMQSGGEPTFQFVDNRPEAVAQRKLQEMANNSPQVSQLRTFQDMANNSPQAKQTAQLQSMADNHSAQQQQPIQKKENNAGLPDNLKTGMENLSGMSLDDVKVHRNSDKPAQLQAHAYAQGTDIHLGPGQEKHLPHEAWHVVQQKQGRVKPTMQMKGKINVNDDVGLEKEADVMGAKASQVNSSDVHTDNKAANKTGASVLQAKSYDVSRSVTLEPHFSSFSDDDRTDKSIKNPKLGREKMLIEALGNLRSEYPLSPENEALAKAEKWNAERRDNERPKGFLGKKAELTKSIADRATELAITRNAEEHMGFSEEERSVKPGFWIRGAHVKGLSVVNERERVNTPESSKAKAILKIKWVGAHIIKRAWGGEDNMLNVVSWPQDAEDMWATSFEDPLDSAFASNRTSSEAVQTSFSKDDEAISSVMLEQIISKQLAGKDNVIGDQDWLKIVRQKAELARINYNRAIEGVPIKASGRSDLGSSNLSSSDTKHEEIKAAAIEKLANLVKGLATKKPKADVLDNFNKFAVTKENRAKSQELEDANRQEAENYRPEIYKLDADAEKNNSVKRR
jgi:hypothetical protein